MSNCPNCGSKKKGRTIYQCRKCGTMYCLEAGFFSSSGCGSGQRCPDCKSSTSGNRKVGTIR